MVCRVVIMFIAVSLGIGMQSVLADESPVKNVKNDANLLEYYFERMNITLQYPTTYLPSDNAIISFVERDKKQPVKISCYIGYLNSKIPIVDFYFRTIVSLKKFMPDIEVKNSSLIEKPVKILSIVVLHANNKTNAIFCFMVSGPFGIIYHCEVPKTSEKSNINDLEQLLVRMMTGIKIDSSQPNEYQNLPLPNYAVPQRDKNNNGLYFQSSTNGKYVDLRLLGSWEGLNNTSSVWHFYYNNTIFVEDNSNGQLLYDDVLYWDCSLPKHKYFLPVLNIIDQQKHNIITTYYYHSKNKLILLSDDDIKMVFRLTNEYKGYWEYSEKYLQVKSLLQ